MPLNLELVANRQRVSAERERRRLMQEDLLDLVQQPESSLRIAEREVHACELDAEKHREGPDRVRQGRQQGAGALEIAVDRRPVAGPERSTRPRGKGEQ